MTDSQEKIQKVVDQADAILSKLPPDQQLRALIAKARELGFCDQEKALKRALWRLRFRPVIRALAWAGSLFCGTLHDRDPHEPYNRR
jgi:hypothetical protein